MALGLDTSAGASLVLLSLWHRASVTAGRFTNPRQSLDDLVHDDWFDGDLACHATQPIAIHHPNQSTGFTGRFTRRSNPRADSHMGGVRAVVEFGVGQSIRALADADHRRLADDADHVA